jgi:hypothetical protein
VIAYKFFDEGRVALYSGVRWPEPGSWLESDRIEPCVSGVHACRIRDLAYWLGSELWEVELDGNVVEGERLVVAQRGRLVRRVEGWNDAAARAFATSCAEEARRRASRSPHLAAYADDAETTDSPEFAAFAAARLAELQDGESGYDAERTRQAGWLAQALGLS